MKGGLLLVPVVGPNGIGKSTLLKLISGDLEARSGTIFRSPKVRLAVFSQHHVDGLDLSKSPLLSLAHTFPVWPLPPPPACPPA